MSRLSDRQAEVVRVTALVQALDGPTFVAHLRRLAMDPRRWSVIDRQVYILEAARRLDPNS